MSRQRVVASVSQECPICINRHQTSLVDYGWAHFAGGMQHRCSSVKFDHSLCFTIKNKYRSAHKIHISKIGCISPNESQGLRPHDHAQIIGARPYRAVAAPAHGLRRPASRGMSCIVNIRTVPPYAMGPWPQPPAHVPSIGSPRSSRRLRIGLGPTLPARPGAPGGSSLRPRAMLRAPLRPADAVRPRLRRVPDLSGPCLDRSRPLYSPGSAADPPKAMAAASERRSRPTGGGAMAPEIRRRFGKEGS